MSLTSTKLFPTLVTGNVSIGIFRLTTGAIQPIEFCPVHAPGKLSRTRGRFTQVNKTPFTAAISAGSAGTCYSETSRVPEGLL